MPRKAAVNDSIYLDEAEGFILEHTLFAPPRTWPPLPPDSQSHAANTNGKGKNLAESRKKMDWEQEVRMHPDEHVVVARRKDRRNTNDHAELRVDDEAIEGEEKGEAGEVGDSGEMGEDGEMGRERCVICLMDLRDPTIVGTCGHEFCFECIGVWANQSRRCPLCSAEMAPFLLHDLDAKVPTKFYLPPLPTRSFAALVSLPGPSRNRLRDQEWARQRESERLASEAEEKEADELDMQVERRREVYRHELYVKHIGSNATSKLRPTSTPRQIAEDPPTIQRVTAFIRRELKVFTDDGEQLTKHIVSLLKAVDIRSEPAIRLLRDVLGGSDDERREREREFPRAGEHFAHEVYSFLRSPFKELWKWDEVAQYDLIPSHSRSASPAQSHRSRSPPISRSPSPLSRSPSPYSRSSSLSPSRSRSRSRSGSRGKRKWNIRDTYAPSLSPDAKRWDESDTWLDPEYAAWVEDERRRGEERIERKRAKKERKEERLRSRYAQQEGRDGGMRAWGKNAVELMPSPPQKATAMAVADGQDREMADEKDHGLTIRGAAKIDSSSPVNPAPPAAAAGGAKLTLLERLAKAKAEAAAKEEQQRQQQRVSPSLQPQLSAAALTLRERLAEAKAEAAKRAADTRLSSTTTTMTNGDAGRDIDQQAGIGAPAPAAATSPLSGTGIVQTTSASALHGRTMKEMIRARLRLRLKLEHERVKNASFTHAQALRQHLLAQRATREAEQVEENYGGMDRVLRKMDVEERKREVRRRLMVLRVLEAETEGERRIREERELKDRLMARRAAATVSVGVAAA